MPITLRNRLGSAEAEARLSRLQGLARERAERLSPYAAAARENAAERLIQAREWTAPRLETAAQRVEDTVAPRVAGLLTEAAHKVEPKRKRKDAKRRIPRTVLILGAGALGAAVVYGVIRLRQAAQETEWQENIDRAREQVRETKDQVAAKVKATKDKVKGDTEEKAEEEEEESVHEFNGRVRT